MKSDRVLHLVRGLRSWFVAGTVTSDSPVVVRVRESDGSVRDTSVADIWIVPAVLHEQTKATIRPSKLVLLVDAAEPDPAAANPPPLDPAAAEAELPLAEEIPFDGTYEGASTRAVFSQEGGAPSGSEGGKS